MNPYFEIIKLKRLQTQLTNSISANVNSLKKYSLQLEVFQLDLSVFLKLQVGLEPNYFNCSNFVIK